MAAMAGALARWRGGSSESCGPQRHRGSRKQLVQKRRCLSNCSISQPTRYNF